MAAWLSYQTIRKHTAVAFCVHAGANDPQIAKRAGHGSVNFTKDRYGHLFPGAEHEARGLLDAYMAREDH